VINYLRPEAGERVLDIGSPKLASVFIWHRLEAEVYATDLFPYFFDEYSLYSERLKRIGSDSGYHIEQQDARCLRYPDCYFDKVYSISTIEHIEDEGDSQAMREIARVLKVGGICCLTVPFAPQYREDSIEYDLYYKKGAPGQPVFWQRRYDVEALQSRLIAPCGLTLHSIKYFGERWFHFERFYDLLPRCLRVLFSIPGPLLSKLFLHDVKNTSISRAKAALLVLRKDNGSADAVGDAARRSGDQA
jgi:SAM-dependent methyltransferase